MQEIQQIMCQLCKILVGKLVKIILRSKEMHVTLYLQEIPKSSITILDSFFITLTIEIKKEAFQLK
jgi:hypothetical protein